jgi:hypothetical protein
VSPVEWSPCCPRTIHLPLTASPCGRLSRPPSTISQYDFHSVVRPPSPCRLVGPYKLSFEPNGSPVFTLHPFGCMLAVRTPGAPQATRTLARPAIPPSPQRDRVGYSDRVRFRGYFPVHFIPAYNLPVYASQWPLPDTTQDSVRGCSLGFAAAAISGDRVQRTCTAQPAQIRTCGFPAYGLYGAFFVKGASRHFCRALLLHSFVRPAPRAFFHPDRTLPSPSRAAAVKDGASSALPKACP